MLRAIGPFVALVFGLTWALDLAIFARGGLAGVGGVGLAVQMFIPGAVALGLSWRSGTIGSLGVRLGRRAGVVYLLAWFGTIALVFGALAASAAVGVYAVDLVGFSGFREVIVAAGQEAALDQMPIQALVAAQLVAVPLAPAINLPVTLGEELGWRGYLQPRLTARLGVPGGLVATGAIWGVWHAPVIAMGHNYPGHPVTGILAMTAMCVLLAVLLGWTRLRTDSVFPAAIAHGALNGSAGAIALFAAAGSRPDPRLVGITGVVGFVGMGALIAVLAGLGELRARPA